MSGAFDPQVAVAIAELASEMKAAPLSQADWSRPFKELELDSLEVASLLLSVEEKFGLKISDQEAEKLSSIRDVAEHVSRRGVKS